MSDHINAHKNAPGIPYTLQLGVDIAEAPSNLGQTLRDAESDGFDTAIVNLFHDGNFRDEKTIPTRQIAHTRADTCINSQFWQSYIIAKIS